MMKLRVYDTNVDLQQIKYEKHSHFGPTNKSTEGC